VSGGLAVTIIVQGLRGMSTVLMNQGVVYARVRVRALRQISILMADSYQGTSGLMQRCCSAQCSVL
jgi:hypothetical protein